MKVLITGGAGFIGQHIKSRLLEAQCEVEIYDICQKKSVFNFHGLKKAVEYNDRIIHLVGFPDANKAQKEPMQSFYLNIRALQYVLEACRIYGNKRIVFPSSAAVYGVTTCTPINETHQINLSSIYSWHKHICEEMIEAYHYNYGIDYVILRLFNVYGKGNKGVINTFIEKAKKGETIKVFGADQTRDFVYASDVADAFYASSIYKGAVNRIINIGSGEGTSIKEILEWIQEIYPCKVTYEPSSLIEYDSIADISLAKALLDFWIKMPKRSIKKVIRSEMA